MLVIGMACVLFLHRSWSRQEPRLVRIGDIVPTMNFSTVRVRGILVSDTRRLRSGSALYRVDDGSGILSVFLIQPPQKELPKAGCRMTMEGHLSVGAGQNIRLHVFSEDQMVVETVKPIKKRTGAMLFDAVTTEQEGKRITVSGQVASMWDPKSGSKAPHKIVLVDSSGKLEVVYWFDLLKRVAIGDQLRITGRVDLYRGKVQLKVWEPSSISIL